MGATDPKSIKEVLVYPVSSPTTMEEFVNPGGVVPSWQSRPVCNKVEAAILDAVIVETSKHLTHQNKLRMLGKSTPGNGIHVHQKLFR